MEDKIGLTVWFGLILPGNDFAALTSVPLRPEHPCGKIPAYVASNTWERKKPLKHVFIQLKPITLTGYKQGRQTDFSNGASGTH